MRKYVSAAILVLLASYFLVSTLCAQTERRGRFTFSPFAGSLGGVDFLAGYRGSAGVIGGTSGGGNIIPEGDAATQAPLVQTKSAMIFGVSIGYLVGLSGQPVNGNFPLSIYGEFSYCPMVKFGDGVETRTWSIWDQSIFQFVEKSDTFSQTNRKAGMLGGTLGAVWIPFSKIPLGLDLGVGFCRFTQEFTSGTMQFLDGKTDISRVTDKSFNTGLSSYAGQGKLERNHSALLIKIGVTYKILRHLSINATFRTASYYDQHANGWIYVESGEDVQNTENHKLATLFSTGITFYL